MDTPPLAQSPNHRGPRETDPLARDGLAAARTGDTEAIRDLVSRGIDIDCATRQNLETMTYTAAANGHPETVRLLSTFQADINRPDRKKKTPVHIAAFKGHEGVVDALGQLGANLDLPDATGVTPLMTAIAKRRAGVVRLLARHGAALDRPSPVHCGPGGGALTPLQVAAQAGCADVVQALVDGGAAPGIQTGPRSVTAIYLAAERGQTDAVRVLAGSKASGLATPCGTGLWNTPMKVAALNNHTGVVEVLAAHGAAVGASTDPVPPYIFEQQRARSAADQIRTAFDRATPLHAAATKGHTAVIEALVRLGAELDPEDAKEATPLMLAAANGRPEAVRALLRLGADWKSQDEQGQTAVHAATRANSVECVEALVAKGGDVCEESSDRHARTPLQMAVSLDKPALLAALLARRELLVPSAVYNALEAAISAGTPNSVPLVNLLAPALLRIEKKETKHPAGWEGGYFPVHDAVIRRNLGALCALGAAGHSMTQGPRATPMYDALEAARAGYTPTTALVDLLVGALGVDVNAPVLASDHGAGTAGDTALITAIWKSPYNGPEAVMRHLLALGADINGTNNAGETPLIVAARRRGLFAGFEFGQREPERLETAKRIALMRFLVQHGADLDHRTNEGKTARDFFAYPEGTFDVGALRAKVQGVAPTPESVQRLKTAIKWAATPDCTKVCAMLAVRCRTMTAETTEAHVRDQLGDLSVLPADVLGTIGRHAARPWTAPVGFEEALAAAVAGGKAKGTAVWESDGRAEGTAVWESDGRAEGTAVWESDGRAEGTAVWESEPPIEQW